ncbi:MAG: ATP-dependent helicase DeaD [Pseudonocardiales bacterium]|nr:ATP-dependent helicase DeaD [Pseudonocardiales bacterium]
MTEASSDLSFEDFGLDRRILQAVQDVGYEAPTPIQAAAIPVLMQGRDLVGLAQTGTGKTAAFALPILSQLDPKRSATQALVIAPTRELVLQVAEAFGRYAHRVKDLHVLPVYGGTPYGPQLHGLRRGAHVVVGTPGRVIDHLEKKTLDLSALTHLVLDEADEMLRMGFQEEVERILAETPDTKQVALFSATMPAPIRKISKRYLHDPVEITVKSKTVTAAKTNQRFLYVTHHQKMDALTRILEVEEGEAMIIFVRTKSATEDVAERLRSRGFAAEAINGDLNQTQREKVIAQLRNGKLDLLVATDVAARGLDVDRVSHVVNYDIPTDPEAYVHRIGRTGRAGRSGEALLFVTPREKGLLNAIEKATRQRLTEMDLPSVADVNAQRVARFHDSITASLSAPTQSMFKGLVLDYAREHDVPLADIAAALAVLGREDQDFLLLPDAAPRERTKPESAPAPAREIRSDLADYRISVGRRHRVTPAQIVGAIANEGGLDRSAFGKIDIRPDHSIVQLPAHLPKKVLQALTKTRIGNQLIELRRERPTGKDHATRLKQRKDR